jgi:hypothetical protein
MYPITSAVKALYDAEQRQVLRITGTDRNGVAINITDANVVLGSFNIDRYSCNGEKLEVGTAIAAEMTLKLDNHNGTFNGIVFEGTELFVEVGIADWTQDNPTVNWMPCGYFTPDQQPRTANQITIHALDRMVNFDVTPPTLTPWTDVDGTYITTESGEPIYFLLDVQYPATVSNIITQLCRHCGIPFTQDISSLPNSGYTIASAPELQQTVTYRNVLQWCAGIMGCNAWIDWNGELQFSWYGATTDYTATSANRFSSDLHEDDITITGVQYTNTQGETIVAGSGDYAVDLTGNYLMAGSAAQIMSAVNTAINGFTYRPFTASVINAPYLWPMDMITFTDRDGNDHPCAVTNVNFGINGAMALAGKGETSQTNSGTAPSGITTEQGLLIQRAVEATEKLDDSLTQQEIFNRLTNGGEEQGIYLQDGKLFINGTFMQIGTIRGANDENYWILDGENPVLVAQRGYIGQFTLENGKLSYTSAAGVYTTDISGSGIRSVFYNDNTDNTNTARIYGGRIEFYWNDTNTFDIANGDEYLYVRNNVGETDYPVQIYNSAGILGKRINVAYDVYAQENVTVYGDFSVSGTKNRAVYTDQYADRLLYCYETPTPYFGDIGEGIIGDDGLCYVAIDPVFAETISTNNYQVFLQRYGEGDCYVKERKSGWFVVAGMPGLSFGWELKAKQRDYDQRRLDRNDEPFTVPAQNYGADAAAHIDEIRKARISA